MQKWLGRRAKRVIALALFALALIQVLPSLADVLNITPDPAPSVSASPSPTESPIAGESPSPSDSVVQSPTSQPTATVIYKSPSPSDTATPEPDFADDQKIILRAPSKLLVDPRATSAYLSPVSVYSKSELLVCLDGHGATLTLTQGVGSALLSGNGSTRLRISGSQGELNQIFGAGHGVSLVAGQRISGKSISIRAVALTAPSLKEEFCTGATASTAVAITALGLGMDTVKNPVKIN